MALQLVILAQVSALYHCNIMASKEKEVAACFKYFKSLGINFSTIPIAQFHKGSPNEQSLISNAEVIISPLKLFSILKEVLSSQKLSTSLEVCKS